MPNLPSNIKKIKILDFGVLSESLKKLMPNNEIISLDIEDIHEYGDKPLIYDGKNIPLKDNSCDVVICLFVLHHIPHQKKKR